MKLPLKEGITMFKQMNGRCYMVPTQAYKKFCVFGTIRENKNVKTKKVEAKVTKYGKQEDAMDVYLDNLLDEQGITYEAISGKGGAFKMMQKQLLEKC